MKNRSPIACRVFDRGLHFFCSLKERADEVQPDDDAAYMYRLGGEYGLGGWGINVGGIGGGIGALGGGAPARAVGAGEGGPYEMDLQDDLFLRAEIGDVSYVLLDWPALRTSSNLL